LERHRPVEVEFRFQRFAAGDTAADDHSNLVFQTKRVEGLNAGIAQFGFYLVQSIQ